MHTPLRLTSILVLAASLAVVAQAQTALPVQLVTAPLHIGDSEQKDMTRAKPDSPAFEGTFVLSKPSRVGDLYLVIKASHLVPKEYPGFDQGFWQTEVFVNDRPAGVLNKQLRGAEETPKVETLVLAFKAALLRDGENGVRIKPGARDGDLDDFELQGVSVETQRPR